MSLELKPKGKLCFRGTVLGDLPKARMGLLEKSREILTLMIFHFDESLHGQLIEGFLHLPSLLVV